MSSSLDGTTLNTNTVNATTVNATNFTSVVYLNLTADSDPYHLPDYGLGVLVIARVYFSYSGVVYPRIYLPYNDCRYICFVADYSWQGVKARISTANLPIKDESHPPYEDFENPYERWTPIYMYNPLSTHSEGGLPEPRAPLVYINDPIVFIYMKVAED